MEKGVPRLLDIGKRTGARFTFFVNYGRSIDRWQTFFASVGRTAENACGARKKMPILAKLGMRDVLRTIFLNPKVGASQVDLLRRAGDEGHEIGLHGGVNHGTWQRAGALADRTQLTQWIEPMLALHRSLAGHGGGFASPGEVAQEMLYPLLADYGFHYVSDLMDSQAQQPFKEKAGLWHIPVAAQFETVPLIEHYRALGWNDDTIIAEVMKWSSQSPLRTYYAHPNWEGYRDLAIFERLVERWKEAGYTLRPYCEAIS
jgi:peptidoglycan/xylan/chitin deacetylase (PgdA/CDA1 family)